MENSRQEWTEEEKKIVSELKDKPRKGWLRVAKMLGRTPDSVRMWYRNNVSNTTKDPTAPKIYADAPIVGVFDVETLPMEVFAWKMFDESFSVEQVIHPTSLLAWSGKVLNAPDVFSDILTPIEALNRDDERITKSCWEFLHQCDIVIGHNLIEFDSRVIATMFLKHGLDPLKYVQIDTLKVAKQNFRFDSNRLAFINQSLGIRDKMSNEGFALWRKCKVGDEKALEEMEKYNRGDVLALEELYYKLRPYIRNMNIALYQDIDVHQCPVCGSTKLTAEGYYYTSAGKYRSLRCEVCRSLSRSKYNQLTPRDRKQLLINS